jgi:hypothetical protein
MSKLPVKIVLETPKAARLPSKLAARIDAFYELRDQRLAYGRKIKEAEAVESALKAREDEIARDLAAEMRKIGDASKLSGQVATFSPYLVDVFTVEDWDAFYEHIEKTHEWDLLERRPARGALKARLEDGKLPGGIKADTKFAYSLTKVGK